MFVHILIQAERLNHDDVGMSVLVFMIKSITTKNIFHDNKFNYTISFLRLNTSGLTDACWYIVLF